MISPHTLDGSEVSGESKQRPVSGERTRSLSNTEAEELANRWAKARVAACFPNSEEELGVLSESVFQDVLDRVGRNSYHLGRSCRQYHGLSLQLLDAIALFPTLGSACLEGQIEASPSTLILRRPGCRLPCSPRVCAYWREAISGLLHGLFPEHTHERFDSRGRGADICVDVLVPAEDLEARFGPIAPELHAGLEEVSAIARKISGAEMRWLGQREGTVFYTFRNAGELSVGPFIERAVRRRFPDLQIEPFTPKPVLT